MTDTAHERYLVTKEVMDILGINKEDTIYKYVKEGLLPGIQIGQEYRFRPSAIKEFERRLSLRQQLGKQLARVEEDVRKVVEAMYLTDALLKPGNQLKENVAIPVRVQEVRSACRELRYKLAESPERQWIIAGCSLCGKPIVVERGTMSPECGCNGCESAIAYYGVAEIWLDPLDIEPVSTHLPEYIQTRMAAMNTPRPTRSQRRNSDDF